MSANYNKVLLIGNLTRDPDLRYTPSGTAVCNFGLAINHKYKDKEETTFVDLEAWQKSAETLAEYARKGDPIFIEGRLKLDSWETQDGQKRNKLMVVCERFQFLGKGDKRREAPPKPADVADARTPAPSDYQSDDDIPF